MNTASIYYHPAGMALPDNAEGPAVALAGLPDFVLIDGDQADIDPAWLFNQVGGDYKLRAIDQACRTLGWRVADNAPIVRQADGRGTVRIMPFALRPGLPPRQDPAPDGPLRHGVAHITQRPIGEGTAWKLLVAVDGKTGDGVSDGPLFGIDPMDHTGAVELVDDILASMAYVRSGPIAPDVSGAFACTADPVPALMPTPPPPDDWRDHPTLLRLNDTVAGELNRAADLLGWPADKLAAQWIVRGMVDARRNHDYFTEPGRLLDPGRIIGWLSDGTPNLRD